MSSRKNFYAVKSNPGRGIYDNWGKCKAVVANADGSFKKNVAFKGFETKQEAEEWMGDIEKKTSITTVDSKKVYTHNPVVSERILNVYTDGSDRDGRLGIGAFCAYDNKEYRYASTCKLSKYNITEKCSNPTAEFIAVTEVVKMFTNRNSKFGYPIIQEIHVWTDYNGIPKWISGEFGCNEPHIKKIKSIFDAVLKDLPKTVKLIVKWVKGHAGFYGNEQADKCAGGEKGELDEFPSLISYLDETYKVDSSGYSTFTL